MMEYHSQYFSLLKINQFDIIIVQNESLDINQRPDDSNKSLVSIEKYNTLIFSVRL